MEGTKYMVEPRFIVTKSQLQRIVRKGIADKYLSGFDRILAKKLTWKETREAIKKRIKTLGIKYLGSGYSRVVAQVSPNMVLKIPFHMNKGVEDNVDEYRIYKQFQAKFGMFTKCKLITSAAGYKYLFAEIVTQLPERYMVNAKGDGLDVDPNHLETVDQTKWDDINNKLKDFLSSTGVQSTFADEMSRQIGIDHNGNLKLFDYSTVPINMNSI